MSRWYYTKNRLPKESQPVYIAFIREHDPFSDDEDDIIVTTGCYRHKQWKITTACTINGQPYVGRTIDDQWSVYAWKELYYPQAPKRK